MNDLATKWSAHAESLIQWSANVAEKAGDFAVEQTPLLVQEYLAWMFMDSAIRAVAWAMVLLGMMAIAIGVVRFINRLEKSAIDDYAKKRAEYEAAPPNRFASPPHEIDKDNYTFARIMTIVVAVMLCTFPLSNAVERAIDAAKIKIAPRVVIVEKISELVKGVK